MSNLESRARFAALRDQLAMQIKLETARAIRHHPHLDVGSAQAYDSLASDSQVDRLIKDVARQEVEKAIARGEVPAAAIIHLAGYRQNPIAEG